MQTCALFRGRAPWVIFLIFWGFFFFFGNSERGGFVEI